MAGQVQHAPAELPHLNAEEALVEAVGGLRVDGEAPGPTARIEGVVTSIGSSFAIVNHDCYVPRHFVNLCRLQVGQPVLVLATQHASGRNKWRAKHVSVLMGVGSSHDIPPDGGAARVSVFVGEITSTGQGFCIVNNDIFVPSSLYEGRGLSDKALVRVHAVARVSGRNKWRAISIEPIASFPRTGSASEGEDMFPNTPMSPFDGLIPGGFSPTPYMHAAAFTFNPPATDSITTPPTAAPLPLALGAPGPGVPTHHAIRHIIGVVTSHGREFCIVNHDVYVPRYLLGSSPQLEDGHTLLRLVICPYRAGRNNWRALSAHDVTLLDAAATTTMMNGGSVGMAPVPPTPHHTGPLHAAHVGAYPVGGYPAVWDMSGGMNGMHAPHHLHPSVAAAAGHTLPPPPPPGAVLHPHHIHPHVAGGVPLTMHMPPPPPPLGAQYHGAPLMTGPGGYPITHALMANGVTVGLVPHPLHAATHLAAHAHPVQYTPHSHAALSVPVTSAQLQATSSQVVPHPTTLSMSRTSSLDSNEPQYDINGTVTSHGTGFCIVNHDVYVPMHLMEGRPVSEGTPLLVRAVQRHVGRNRYRAISVSHSDTPPSSPAVTVSVENTSNEQRESSASS